MNCLPECKRSLNHSVFSYATMKLRQSLIFSFIILFVIVSSCHVRNISYFPIPKEAHANFRLLAWNEDSVNSILFSIGKSNNFRYTITTHELGKEQTTFYQGIWTKSGDKLLLHYNDLNVPVSFKEFLVIEIQGHYLIQYRNDNKDRIYLRIMFEPDARHGSLLPRPW